MTAFKSFIIKYKIQILLCLSAVLACVIFRNQLTDLYSILTDREGIKDFIDSCGAGAPFVFIGFQVLQVMFAPVPGEISGFVGGYLFGTFFGFIYSSIGLTAGSVINFWVGRVLGYRFVRRVVPKAKLEKFDAFISHQGVIVLLSLFIFPGFPKDYLCLFLGVTTLPFKIFILLAGFGRMPGTLMLSLQGEFLFAQNYWVLGAIVLVSLSVLLLAFKFRKTLYGWAEPINKR
ncbi:MAG: TVP38/TMEM64 family protein [Desulfobacteraceae bacterium]|nr:TVP38/TMEM64 family protein [Desulfobacteraceae bacterium]MBC2754046.1 TVP38/TMEM64 family protein [Desulfobacteraceae bacterium]